MLQCMFLKYHFAAEKLSIQVHLPVTPLTVALAQEVNLCHFLLAGKVKVVLCFYKFVNLGANIK